MSVLTLPETNKRKQPSCGVECRVWERHACRVPTSCQPVAARGPDELSWQGYIQEISAGGVGLVAERRFESGCALAIQVPCEDDPDGETHLLRVLHVRRAEQGGWVMGCAFVNPIGEDEVQKFVQQGDMTPAENVKKNGVYQAAQVEPVNGWPSKVISELCWHNRETGKRRYGQRLNVKGAWPLKPKTVLTIRLAAKHDQPKPSRILVHSCSFDQDRWVVRFSFLKETPEILLRWFGRE